MTTRTVSDATVRHWMREGWVPKSRALHLKALYGPQYGPETLWYPRDDQGARPSSADGPHLR